MFELSIYFRLVCFTQTEAAAYKRVIAYANDKTTAQAHALFLDKTFRVRLRSRLLHNARTGFHPIQKIYVL